MKQEDIINKLLDIDHRSIAYRLGFINDEPNTLEESLAIKAVGLIDVLSRSEEAKSRRTLITLAALLWTYKNPTWEYGLKNRLLLALSRSGFAPSAKMFDEGFSSDSDTYSSMGSIFNQYAVALHHYQYEIKVVSKIYTVTKFQRSVWEKLHDNIILGISAPTSAGKSFIILLKAIELLHSANTNIVYIVPTLSLVSQVYGDFKSKLKEFELHNVSVHTTVDVEIEDNTNNVFILTQEKAITAFSYTNVVFNNTKLLVVDEIQNIERVAEESNIRSKVLYDTLIEFRNNTCKPLTILSGPRIDSLKTLGVEIFGGDCTVDEEKTKDSPVASVTYAISKQNDTYYFDQYSDIQGTPHRIQIENECDFSWYGTYIYRPAYYDFLNLFTEKINTDSTNIIFSPTSDKAVDIISNMCKTRPIKQNQLLESLSKYIKATVNENYGLAEYVRHGVAYHHGKMPMHIRSAIEYAVQEKLIDDIACTTTLMQGVNLPVQNIVIRNPHLRIKADQFGKKPQLTNYEIANLRGRAGRLLKDFIGRTYILDSSTFQPDEQTQILFPEAEKELTAGYGSQYDENKRKIKDFLFDGKTVDNTLVNGSDYLVTYIRYNVLRYGEGAIQKLNQVGINITRKDLELTQSVLNTLDIDKSICLKNRYWDPLVLNSLYTQRNDFDLPTGVASANIADKLRHVVSLINQRYPIYGSKYWRSSQPQERAVFYMAENWVKEKSISSIFSNKFYDNSSNIEKGLQLLQTNISYGIPALLKPIYDIKYTENTFLRFVELGAYNPITRKLIELNVPRETAIYLSKNLFNFYDQSSINTAEILNVLRENRSKLDAWVAIQIRNII